MYSSAATVAVEAMEETQCQTEVSKAGPQLVLI